MGKYGSNSHHQGNSTQQSPAFKTYVTYYDPSGRPFWWDDMLQPPHWGHAPYLQAPSRTTHADPSHPPTLSSQSNLSHAAPLLGSGGNEDPSFPAAKPNNYVIGTQNGMNRVPESLLECTIFKVFVEHLVFSPESTEGVDGLKNHDIFKFDFKHAWNTYKGARLEMNMGDMNDNVISTNPASGNEAIYMPGELVLKPVKYKYQSHSAVRLIELELRKDRSLRAFISAVFHGGLRQFNFVEIQNRFFGCWAWVYVHFHNSLSSFPIPLCSYIFSCLMGSSYPSYTKYLSAQD